MVRAVEPSNVAIYSIGAVERMLGVPAATLRNWEERYGLIRPQRSRGGHRLYTRDQVEQLGFLTAQLELGLQAAEAHRVLAERLEGRDAGPLSQAEADEALLIVLADRDPHAAEFAEFFLRTEGYQVLLAFDADAAARLFDEHSPQLAVIELLISGGTGGALCRLLKQQNEDAACLAVSSLDARNEALEMGADAFLQKPLDPLHLVSTVKDLLGTSSYLRARATSPI